MLCLSSLSRVIALNSNAESPASRCRGNVKALLRNSVTALAEPAFVLVDIPDSGPDTLNQFSDRFPVPNRCPDFGTHWTDPADCPRFRCPMLDYFQREPSNMRAAAIHRENHSGGERACRDTRSTSV